MEISNLTLKLIILLVPGAIAAKIIQRVTIHKSWSEFQFVVNSILLGVASYSILQVAHMVGNYVFGANVPPSLEVWRSISKSDSIPYKEVIWSSAIATAVGFLGGAINHYRLINRMAQKFKVSNKYGDENLYSHFLNDDSIQMIYVRDIKNGLTYHGCIESFSEVSDNKELVLSSVTIYRYEDSKELYGVGRIYLSLRKEDIIIELANPLFNEQEPSGPEDLSRIERRANEG